MNSESVGNTATADFERRIQQLRRSMQAAGIDALVILSPSNIEYLTGIDLFDFQPMETSQGIGKFVYVSEEQSELVYYGVTSPGIMQTVTWLDHVIYDQPEDPASLVERRITADVAVLGVEGTFLPYNISKRLEHSLPAVGLVDSTRVIYELRMVKSDEEVRRLRRSRTDSRPRDGRRPREPRRTEGGRCSGRRNRIDGGTRCAQRCLLAHRVIGGEVWRRDLRRHRAKDRQGRLRHDRSGRKVQGLPL